MDKDPITLQNKLQCRANKVVEWLMDNKMVVAPKKTKLIISATKKLRNQRHPNLDVSITVCGNTIHPTCSEKLLGVILSEDLTWTLHI